MSKAQVPSEVHSDDLSGSELNTDPSPGNSPVAVLNNDGKVLDRAIFSSDTISIDENLDPFNFIGPKDDYDYSPKIFATEVTVESIVALQNELKKSMKLPAKTIIKNGAYSLGFKTIELSGPGGGAVFSQKKGYLIPCERHIIHII